MEHLTEPQRYIIEAMLKERHKQSEIDRVIGKNKPVVSRHRLHTITFVTN